MPLVEVGVRVVVEHHRQVDIPVDVVEHPGDRGRAAVDEQVLGVRAPSGVEPHPGALAHGVAADVDGVASRVE